MLGSREKTLELGQRYLAFENDEVFLEDALTYLFTQRKMTVKDKYTFEEVNEIVREAMAERNSFLRECAKQYKNATAPLVPL